MSNVASILPNLEVGMETPWPLKREGRQVYAKLIDFGGFPPGAGFRAKTHDVPDIEWKQISWDHSYIASSTDGRRRSLALASTPESFGGTLPWRFLVDAASVQVNMQSLTNYQEWDTIVLCLLYTRSGEGEKSGSLVQPGPEGAVLTSRDNGLVWEEGAGSGRECAVATPQKPGLVPEGGRPGEFYAVSEDGDAYVWQKPRTEKAMITESGEWTPPAMGIYRIRAVGGGGGAGYAISCAGQMSSCGGGSSGEEADLILHIDCLDPIPCDIGAGGAGARAEGGANGASGGITSFGEYLTVAGGLGSGGNYNNANVRRTEMGADASGPGSRAGASGSIRVLGAQGEVLAISGGAGGTSSFGTGGAAAGIVWGAADGFWPGKDASGYGSGGGGGVAKGAHGAAGGNGAPGVIEITRIL